MSEGTIKLADFKIRADIRFPDVSGLENINVRKLWLKKSNCKLNSPLFSRVAPKRTRTVFPVKKTVSFNGFSGKLRGKNANQIRSSFKCQRRLFWGWGHAFTMRRIK